MKKGLVGFLIGILVISLYAVVGSYRPELNDYSGTWTAGTRLDISSAAQKHITLDRDTRILRLWTDSEIRLGFDTASSTANTTNDVVLPRGYYEIPVPRGLYVGETLLSPNVIYVHIKQVTSAASKYVSFVES